MEHVAREGFVLLWDPTWDMAPSKSPEVPTSASPHGTGAPRPLQMPLGSPYHWVFIIRSSEAFCAARARRPVTAAFLPLLLKGKFKLLSL